jgi:hypothetical protein
VPGLARERAVHFVRDLPGESGDRGVVAHINHGCGFFAFLHGRIPDEVGVTADAGFPARAQDLKSGADNDHVLVENIVEVLGAAL